MCAVAGQTGYPAARETEGGILVGKIIGRRYRFVDDYKKTVYVGANGRPKDRITYIGQWVCPLNDESDYSRIVLVSRIAICVAAAALIAALLIMPGNLSNKWYMPVAALAMFPLVYAIMGAFAMPGRKKPMERKKFSQSFERSKISAIAALVILALSALIWLVIWILAWTGKLQDIASFAAQDVVYIVCLVIAAAACFVIIRKTKEVKTELRENSACKPE